MFRRKLFKAKELDMRFSIVRKVFLTLLIVICSTGLLYFKHTQIPLVDERTDIYFEEVSQRSVSAYAITRGINAIVSVIKESNVLVSPAGVGINVAAGQVLDPLDDMTERLSSVLVLSIVSIGIQKMTMEIGQLFSFQLIGCLFPLLILPLWSRNQVLGKVVTFTAKLIVVLTILRFFLPGSMMLNNIFYTEFLEENIVQTKEKLRVISDSGGELGQFDTIQYDDGIIDTLNSSLDSMALKMGEMKRVFNKIENNLGEIIDSLLDLTIYYMMIFLVQILLIPVFALWLTLRLVDNLFKSELKTVFMQRIQGGQEKVCTT